MNISACKKENGIYNPKTKQCFTFYNNVPNKKEAKELVNNLKYVHIGTTGGIYRKAKKGYDVYASHWR